jgi:rubrerythrin
MFLSVVEDEKRHIIYINQLIKGMDFKPEEITPMQNIKTVFEQGKDAMMERAGATKDEMEAFRIAMKMEKEGMEFYRASAAQAPTAKEKALFERLAAEEEQHFAIFQNTCSFLTDTGNWFMWDEHAAVDGGTATA